MAHEDTLAMPRGISGGIHYDPEAFGRFSETLARFFGTARFLAIQSIIVVMWITFNAVAASLSFDPYPFILLNLAFSTQAAYAAPLILLAQNRQAERDRAEVERDRDAESRQLADTDFLAREIAAMRIALEAKASREDIAELVAELAETIEGAAEGSTRGGGVSRT
ncbi:MAG TPA: DUF1003 domain-containing protein [Acidimicrobiales bacterium]|jgi:uncharacterized membrane protein|nr:DUF1003 domain-containing protein [Acidimicrobiales bacterium]